MADPESRPQDYPLGTVERLLDRVVAVATDSAAATAASAASATAVASSLEGLTTQQAALCTGCAETRASVAALVADLKSKRDADTARYQARWKYGSVIVAALVPVLVVLAYLAGGVIPPAAVLPRAPGATYATP